jgi:hypothetical protein
MKKLLLTLLILNSSLVVLKAQTNLVQNPSFEVNDTCPSNSCQISYAKGWSCYKQCVDYFNSCYLSPYNVGIPYNRAGFQNAASGNAYAGEWFYAPTASLLHREYLGTQLSTPLIIGIKYYVTFKVCLCSIDSALEFDCAVNKQGVQFSTIQYSFTSPAPTNNFAQVYTNTIITDTLNWTTIRGSFIADSVYKYLAIGNFFTDTNISKKYFFNDPEYAAYYYIDDVCVSTDSNYCADWKWTGINEITDNSELMVNVCPNPFTEVTTVEVASSIVGPFSLTIYNLLGEELQKMDNIRGNKISIRRGTLSGGVYFFIIKNNKEFSNTGKLVIE